MPIERIAVLVTSFNRRETTLAALATLFKQEGIENLSLDVFLVDDGCTDGTGDAVHSAFPQVHILRGDGTLFWNGGMCVAFDAALKKGFDAYVFMNDDTLLYQNALSLLIHCAEIRSTSHRPAIVVGNTVSRITGKHTYGGYVKRTKGLRLWFEMVEMDPTEEVPCETMNCNFVLIPDEVTRVVGTLERRFHHQFGDLDYGLRAKRAGFDVVVAPGSVGTCEANLGRATWRDEEAVFKQRWRNLNSPKGVPFSDWLLFIRRHYGWRWLPYAFSPYLKTIVSAFYLVPPSRT